jgi:hypothetical protein
VNFKRSRWKGVFLVAILLFFIASILTACRTYSPSGQKMSPAEAGTIQTNLQKTIIELAKNIGERNLYRPAKVEQTLAVITNSFLTHQYREISLDNFVIDTVNYSFQGAVPHSNACNVIVEKKGSDSSAGIIVVGAHYDTIPFTSDWTGVDRGQFRPRSDGTPGADDNGSGVAALLEIARLLHGDNLKKTIRFVTFANEEPPFFEKKEAMGSSVYAAQCKNRREDIRMMVSLDTMGLYTRTDANTKRGSLKSCALSLFGLTQATDYVAFLSNWQGLSGPKTLAWAKVFSTHSTVRVKALSVPYFHGEYFAWSDDWSFTQRGYPAFCVTDTAMYRSDRYHEDWDTPERLIDYTVFAEVVGGLAEMIRVMASR